MTNTIIIIGLIAVITIAIFFAYMIAEENRAWKKKKASWLKELKGTK